VTSAVPAPVDLQKQDNSAARMGSVEKMNQLLNQKKSDEAKDEREEYLFCVNQGASFAVPVKYIQEILPNREDRPLPVKRKNISGVISFRGKVMAIVNLLDSKDRSDLYGLTRCIVVCQIEKKQFGFRVDHVSSVLGVNHRSLQPLPVGADETSIVRNFAFVEGKTVSFVDPRLVVAA
jgi:chemotaxis signal transduction protein